MLPTIMLSIGFGLGAVIGALAMPEWMSWTAVVLVGIVLSWVNIEVGRLIHTLR